jgi:hypothetical protein
MTVKHSGMDCGWTLLNGAALRSHHLWAPAGDQNGLGVNLDATTDHNAAIPWNRLF